VKLRLYHHPTAPDRVPRGRNRPPLALLHSRGLSHREWEPIVDELAHRYRVVLPDLPLHGDPRTADAPVHAGVVTRACSSGFLQDACGPRPLVGGHGVGAQLALRAIAAGALKPARLVLMPSDATPAGAEPARALRARHHARRGRARCDRPARTPARSRSARARRPPERHARAGRARSRPPRGPGPRRQREPRPLLGEGRQALAAGAQQDLLDAYRAMDFPVLLLWADEDPRIRWRSPRRRSTCCPTASSGPPTDRLPDRVRRPDRRGEGAVAFCG
jgi:pimeloyl-ACP methyl ester carboxylesterase